MKNIQVPFDAQLQVDANDGMAYINVALMGLRSLPLCLTVCVCVSLSPCASPCSCEIIITGSFYIKKRESWIERKRARVASLALQNERRQRSLSLFYCCMFPDAYPTYLQWWKKKGREWMNILFLLFLLLPLSVSPLFSSLIRWTKERWGWQWQARQRHAKCRLSLSVNRRTSWRVISLMDYKVGNNDSAFAEHRSSARERQSYLYSPLILFSGYTLENAARPQWSNNDT